MEYYDKVIEAKNYIESKTEVKPVIACILGSGLGSLVDKMNILSEIEYRDIPYFPSSKIEGHADKLILGYIGNTPAVFMQGRFHYYEGLSMKELTFPIYVLKMLGVKSIIITNACGGINESFKPGDLMLITDHINLLGLNPLIGENDERFGPRFPDMTEVYNKEYIEKARAIAGDIGFEIKEGTYAYFNGPCYETAAEIRAYKTLGADTVVMSTVPEATVANYLGLKILGVACITNMATGLAKEKHSHKEVLETADKASKRFSELIYRFINELSICI